MLTDMKITALAFLLVAATAKARFTVRGATRASQENEICKLSSTPFTAKVALALQGETIPEHVFDDVLSSFRESFNRSNKQACDAAHRRIIHVELDSTKQRAGTGINLLLNIQGMYCSECIRNGKNIAADGMPLFDFLFEKSNRELPAGEHRSLKKKHGKKKKEKKHKSSSKSKWKKFKKSKSKKSKSATYSPTPIPTTPPSALPTPVPTSMPTIDACACASATTRSRSNLDFKDVYQAALNANLELPTLEVLFIEEVT
jgi:hypothetical protein